MPNKAAGFLTLLPHLIVWTGCLVSRWDVTMGGRPWPKISAI